MGSRLANNCIKYFQRCQWTEYHCEIASHIFIITVHNSIHPQRQCKTTMQRPITMHFYITKIKYKTRYFPDNRTSIAGAATTGTAVSPHRLLAGRTSTNPGGSCGGPRRSRSGVKRCKATSTRRWNDCGRAPCTGPREATQVCPITTWRLKSFVFLFFKIFLEDISSVSHALISLFWTSDDVCHWFQSERGSFAYMLPRLKGFLRFTSGATPADLLMAIMVVEPFSIHGLVHVYTSIGGTMYALTIGTMPA